MDAAVRLLAETGPLGFLLLGGAILGALAAVIFLAVGLRRLDQPGNPRLAIAVAVGFASLLLLPFFGSFAAITVPGDDPVLATSAALRNRMVCGAAGLLLAFPCCLAAGLWAGIAAGRRVRLAGERARLSATAAGQAALGQRLAAVLERTQLPWVGAGIGLVAAVFVAGAPSLALLVAGTRGLENLVLLVGLDEISRALVGHLQARATADTLRLGARVGAAGAVLVALLVGLVLHAASSRRRNLLVAARTVNGGGPAQSAVERALAATGRPGPLGPLALALLLLLLAALTWWETGKLRAAGEREAAAVQVFHSPPAAASL